MSTTMIGIDNITITSRGWSLTRPLLPQRASTRIVTQCRVSSKKGWVAAVVSATAAAFVFVFVALVLGNDGGWNDVWKPWRLVLLLLLASNIRIGLFEWGWCQWGGWWMSSSSSTTTTTTSILSWRCLYLWLLWKKWRDEFSTVHVRRYFHTPSHINRRVSSRAAAAVGIIESHS